MQPHQRGNGTVRNERNGEWQTPEQQQQGHYHTSNVRLQDDTVMQRYIQTSTRTHIDTPDYYRDADYMTAPRNNSNRESSKK